MDDFLDDILGDRIETYDAAVGRSVELEVLLLRALHGHSLLSRRGETKQKCVGLVLLVWVRCPRDWHA